MGVPFSFASHTSATGSVRTLSTVASASTSAASATAASSIHDVTTSGLGRRVPLTGAPPVSRDPYGNLWARTSSGTNAARHTASTTSATTSTTVTTAAFATATSGTTTWRNPRQRSSRGRGQTRQVGGS